ncbi:MAG: hypothetical protein A2312_03595 [Candidatus Staskawiczbacteria bacterium RIFOXYB2_FULL_32_9]|uniref:DUF2283 domain-containing protein n=1 Tax=Candidatus Staskawiczbacteria bacterium RIFOXYD1_FULL_32_13 TaxID=1802234 RepID=A0A1G2JRB0_9BACT|nr:MAG: hypothetical protein UR22_C0011G0019 [Parcubacteria group bacterium GW2011_GWC2_32_10]OGZ77918.1 MAG: hypothetical protein A2360_00105 [Candidatus Staskawiczbacteria bacterium RIFOXYB1_FULL_32_11]OGZ78324.1 MAG: hypothetical protein A2256_01655 [Candidatus Staskawiczbacteria bacterium RIFOXYA2_FULL_32_7]OGZ82540.1 MAG: hypothetical protein A2312_03595 [Candidatus Staskawiczbacteria bacterium RIFOXYB2_FULL_32_9]OGZ87454.1 MAG: hypothetical protein A2463_04810 [Candidatus Staskawiczbacter
MAKTNIKYDKEAKILSIRVSDKKSVDSDAKGNVVIDYDKNGNVVNIDVMKISLDEFSKIESACAQI